MREAVRAEDGDLAHANHNAIHPPKEREEPLCTERVSWHGMELAAPQVRSVY